MNDFFFIVILFRQLLQIRVTDKENAVQKHYTNLCLFYLTLEKQKQIASTVVENYGSGKIGNNNCVL